MPVSKGQRAARAKTLDDIRRLCTPAPLEGDELNDFFVETDAARDPHQKTRERLKQSLDCKEDARLLFYGHRGCGKSTELNKFLLEQGDRFLPVKFSVQSEMTASNVRAEDLMLVITERVLDVANANGLKVNHKSLAKVQAYFEEHARTTKTSTRTTARAGGGIDAKSSVMGKLLGFFVTLRGDIQHDSYSENTMLAKVRKRPAELLEQANLVIEAVRSGLPPEQRLLIVVEDIDKLDLKLAREMYVNNATLLAGIRTNIIYTIPVFLFHSPDAGSFRPYFDDVIPLPMIKVTDPPKKRAVGFETIKRIVLSRVEDVLISADALELLIEKTGGVLRQVFQVLHTISVMADVKPPIQKEQVQYGLDQLKKEFWQQVSLPYETFDGVPKSVNDLYERLTEYAKKQLKGEKAPPVADPTNQVLLKSCALIEYNGQGWFGVHPLVIENLRAMGRIE